MNYKEMLHHQQAITDRTCVMLYSELRELCGAVSAIKRLMLTSGSALGWLTNTSKTDVVELLRLYTKPATFARVYEATRPQGSQWRAIESQWKANPDEIIDYLKHLTRNASSEERVRYVLGQLLGMVMMTEYTAPQPVSFLIQGTIFEAIWQKDRTAFLKHMETASVNSTIEPVHDTCLIFAIRYKCLQPIDWILEDPCCNVNIMNGRGDTALQLASKMGLNTVVEALRERGAFDC